MWWGYPGVHFFKCEDVALYFLKLRVKFVIFPKKIVTIKCQKAKANEKIVILVYYIFEPVGQDYNLEPADIFLTTLQLLVILIRDFCKIVEFYTLVM